jgi:hypothetical protein
VLKKNPQLHTAKHASPILRTKQKKTIIIAISLQGT